LQLGDGGGQLDGSVTSATAAAAVPPVASTSRTVSARVTPAQIALVEQSLASLDLDTLAVDFYERAFAADHELSRMFTTDPAVQRVRFVAELDEIVGSIQSLEAFAARACSLGERHRGYGVHAAHYRLMGDALLGGLAAGMGEGWTADLDEAWRLAYNLTAEPMMMGALDATGDFF
jgi:hemoglobin-like flavoprotein